MTIEKVKRTIENLRHREKYAKELLITSLCDAVLFLIDKVTDQQDKVTDQQDKVIPHHFINTKTFCKNNAMSKPTVNNYIRDHLMQGNNETMVIREGISNVFDEEKLLNHMKGNMDSKAMNLRVKLAYELFTLRKKKR